MHVMDLSGEGPEKDWSRVFFIIRTRLRNTSGSSSTRGSSLAESSDARSTTSCSDLLSRSSAQQSLSTYSAASPRNGKPAHRLYELSRSGLQLPKTTRLRNLGRWAPGSQRNFAGAQRKPRRSDPRPGSEDRLLGDVREKGPEFDHPRFCRWGRLYDFVHVQSSQGCKA